MLFSSVNAPTSCDCPILLHCFINVHVHCVINFPGVLRRWSKVLFPESYQQSAADKALGGGLGNDDLDVSRFKSIQAEREIRNMWLQQAQKGGLSEVW